MRIKQQTEWQKYKFQTTTVRGNHLNCPYCFQKSKSLLCNHFVCNFHSPRKSMNFHVRFFFVLFRFLALISLWKWAKNSLSANILLIKISAKTKRKNSLSANFRWKKRKRSEANRPSASGGETKRIRLASPPFRSKRKSPREFTSLIYVYIETP